MAILAPQPPLVGRESELGTLQERLSHAEAGNGGLVVISGEAGIGKTSLIDEFGKLAAKKGVSFLVGRCIPGGASPYLPFQDALGKMRTHPRKELGLMEWLRGTGNPAVHGPRLGEQHIELENGQAMYWALDLFRELCREKVLTVVLDDLHWADSASVQLLHFLARNCRDLRMLILGSYRPEDVMPDQAGRVHPLLESLRAMRREGIVHEMALDRLTFDELEIALEGMLAGQVDPELFRRIAKESGGNPLYAVELLRLLFQTESIAIRDGVWKSDPHLKTDIPPTVREVLVGRVERLTKDERRMVESAAVIGEWFDPELVSQVLGTERLNVLEVLDNIQRTSQLVKAAEETYRFSHEKVRQVTYNEISPLRRKELHKRTGEALETGAFGQTYGDLSTHFYQAGETKKCIKYSILAGQNALNKFALREANEYFHNVIDLAKNDPAYGEETIQSLEGIADSSLKLGIIDQAIANYRSFLEHCQDPAGRARVQRKLAQSLSYTLKDFSEPILLLQDAERHEDLDPLEIARIKMCRANIAHSTGVHNEAEKLYSQARESLQHTGNFEDLADVLADEATLFLSLGRVKEALDAVKRADEIFRSSRNPSGEHVTSFILGVTYFHLGMVQEALSSYARNEEIGSKFGLSLRGAYIWRGMLYYSVDDFERARLQAIRGVEECRRTSNLYWGVVANILLALSEARMRRIADAENALRQARELGEVISGQERSPMRSYLAMAQAEVYAAKKEWSLCNEKFREAIQGLNSAVYRLLFEALARVRFGEASIRQGLIQEARDQFSVALQLYEKLGNTSQVDRVGKLSVEAMTQTSAS